MMRRLSDVVMSTGIKVLDEYVLQGRRAEEPVLIPFYPPVDPGEFVPADPGRRAAARDALGVPRGAFVVGTVGNRNPQKAQHHLIRAFAKGVRRDGAALRVVGHEAAGHERYEALLSATVADCDLPAGVVRRPPPGLTIPEVLSAFDVFALSSDPRSEGVPTVVLEAMACALPVVALDTGGISEVLLREAGTVLEPGNVEGFGAELARLQADPGLRAARGAAGRRLVETRFGVTECLASHVRAYEAAVVRA
jgi:glycosyltransferase involved in cell wall biosynthesis